MQPGSATSVVLEQLLARLDVEQDEVAVASVAATRSPDSEGVWQLVYGSLLFGVQEMADTSWLGWRSHTEAAAGTTLAMLSATGLQEPDLAQFIFQDSEWLMARLVLPGPDRAIDTAAAWLAALLGKGVALTDATGDTHLVQAQLAPADALVLGCRYDDGSRLQRLTRAAQRPVLGYRFPREDPVGATVPHTWPVGSSQVARPLYELLGIGDQSTDDQGLVVGRVGRTAWLASLHMDNDQQLHAHIGFDPERVALGDLEIDLEEYAEDGLAQARRLRLADLRLPATKPGDTAVVVLPTLGSKISRQVRLYARGGRLLDATARNYFVSQINMTITEQRTGAATTLNVGDASADVTMVTRLTRLDEAEREYRRLLNDGLTQRIFDNAATAVSALQQMLGEARGHLLVLDPYFGQKSTDWDALDKVTVPVKVLAQHEKPWRASPRPVAVPDPSVVQRHSTGLELRSWDINQAGRSAPWHDRVYLWQHGGLTVGTSPSGLGRRLARVDRLSPVEAAAWEARFNVWWADPLAIVVR